MTRKIFRTIVIIDFAVSFLATVLSWSRFSNLPPELADIIRRDYEKHLWLNTLLWMFSTSLFLIELISFIGLLMLRNWARYTFLIFVGLWLLTALQPGLSAGYTWMGFLGAIALISCGAIVSTIIWPPYDGFFVRRNRQSQSPVPYA